MTSELKANIIAVERTKKYAEVANEVCVVTWFIVPIALYGFIGTSYYLR